MHLVDRGRADSWRPELPVRELAATVYYPAAPTGGCRDRAPYMLPGAAAHFDAVTANSYLGLGTPAGTDWAGTATHACQDAPAAATGGPHPVLVYSPGLGEPRSWATTLVEQLAAHGYVVVTLDSTYEAPEVEFPDGRVATNVPYADPAAFITKSLAVRTADTRFLLDELTRLAAGRNPDADGRPLPARLSGALDLDRIGMFGHSLGGTAAADTMAADPRVRAGVDLDGNLTNFDGSLMPVAEHGLDRPFLLVGTDNPDGADTAPGFAAFRANTPGWTRQLQLRGAAHASFTDAEVLLPQLGLDRAELTSRLGTLPPAAALRTERAYLAAYFDHWLRGGDSCLLDGPSPAYPAMGFVG
ncbi:Tat pathway signal protein [Streptomyces tateyamensis]|uniref:Tat pathway signal protein n=1 Tax=Streptomyces tateyamensis TaxID=565073 RepID=A0A2V4P8W4_9ACTN|nr:Tat pathway signal protein [Streptomyces tateyamensis]